MIFQLPSLALRLTNGDNIKKSINKEGYGTIFIEEFTSKFDNCNITLDRNDSFHYHISFEMKD